ncbi:hypothetical protein DOTSEDRAFT_73214 [Lecanosticta acicola]|uniref:Carrier domain-containing protein n=1 Tax=Lecanosticta acicola TaxID=111012 RepID=A0AAI8Z8B1_9PEZI|nr:hypothetical protein DOTSEDRAFT_73214 [Lecanosticta acicola]
MTEICDTNSVYAKTRRLPDTLEELSRDYPDQTLLLVPNDEDLKHGWRSITYRHLANAVDGMCRWIEAEFGAGQRNIDVAAYMGYLVTEIALMKAGYKALLPSPRNSQEGQASLFKTTKCNILIHSQGVDTHIDSIKSALPDVRTKQIPSFEELEQQGRDADHPYQGPPGDRDDNEVLILHTSGSTGLPKPIYHTHTSISTVTAAKALYKPQGRRNVQDPYLESDRLLLTTAPFFHMMGQAILWRTIHCRAPLVAPPPEKPVMADLVIEVIKQTKPSCAIFPPSVLEEIAEAPRGMEALGTLEYCFYGGGPLALGIGNKVTHVTHLLPVIGSTEAGLMPCRMPEDRHEWRAFEWAPGSGIDMEPEQDSDALYECVIKPADRRFQGIFHTFPGISEWRTKDLFERHPNNKNLWFYKGRKDDVLVLSNGEKFNPVGFEKTLESNALIKGALVVGQARFQTGLIIEPEWSLVPHGTGPEQLLDEFWPLIEEANAASPAHGRVWRSKVAIAKRDKPFKRSPKGSINRRQTTDLYKPEIDAIYANEASDDDLGRLQPDADLDTALTFVRNVFKAKGVEIPDSASDDQDLFSFGMDSLQVLALSSTLSHATGTTVAPRDIYGHPSIAALAGLLRGPQSGDATPALSREEAMAKMVEKYTHDLSSRRASGPKERAERHTYIVTGTTGSLGNYILQDLLVSPQVGHVYCLNRSADAEARQRQSFQDRGLSADFSKATFLQADFGQDRFGLSHEIYERLLRSVDIFIHSAWAVNFNKTLQTYEGVHVAGTRRCVDFSLDSKYRTQIVFISSIASVGAYPVSHPEDKEVPEQIFEDHSVPLPQGYGESKHVASLILANAARDAGVPATVIRAGQLAGPKGDGAPWNRHEWLPSIVISSKALGMVPQRLGNQDVVDWVPMDLAAKSVVDIAETRAQQDEALAVAHLVNPHTVSWSDLVPHVEDSLAQETGKEIQVVSFRTWLDELKKAPQTPEEIEKKPGIKLIDFYEGLLTEGGGLPPLATKETQKMSETVRTMEAVDAPVMRKWLTQWRGA